MAGVRILLFACLLLPGSLLADEKLWSLLERGGQVVLIRHAATTPGAGDPPGMRLDDCGTQRNLSEEGRAHARRIGEEFRRRKIPVEQLLSSPWCRCLETARLAFGEPQIAQSLSNHFGRQETRAQQVHAIRALLERPKSGTRMLVSHGSTILALTGVSPATGEMVLVSREGRALGRLAP